MNKISVQLKKVVDESYGITVESGLLSRLPRILVKEHPASSYVIVADTNTVKRFGNSLSKALTKTGCSVLLLTVPAGEASKSQNQKTKLEETMLKAGVDRRGVVLALGGGVVGDLASFVASTYMRGISCIQIPTTTLAMIDSAIGGKTGINTLQGKNLIGAFHQPKAVYVDVDTLGTLPSKELRRGLVEAVKAFITSDAKSFKVFEKSLDSMLSKDKKALEDTITRAVHIKAEVVASDERESGERMILNFGHTIGHAIEKLSKYRVSHGEAVAAGILVETQIAYIQGKISATYVHKIQKAIKRLNLRTASIIKRFPPKAIVKATFGDKKSMNGRARYVLVTKIGAVSRRDGQCVEYVSDKDVLRALEDVSKAV